MKLTKDFFVSLLLLLICSILAKHISSFSYFKIIGHLVIALLLGMLLQVNLKAKSIARVSSPFVSNKFLRLGIILMGFKLNLSLLFNKGKIALPLAFLVILITISLVYYISKKLGVGDKLSLVTACGTAVCGAAAVLGVSPIIKNNKDEEVISIAVVAILGTFFTLVLVILRPFLNLTEIQYGALAGLSLHEIAHAVAAGGSFSEKALQMATITKLSRVIMLVPLSIFLSVVLSKKNDGKFKISIPWFMLGFLISSALGTYVPIFRYYAHYLEMLAFYLLAMAMAGLGVGVNFNVIKEKGKGAFLAAFVSSVILMSIMFIVVKMAF